MKERDVPMIENPRRRRRRLSAKQKRAGFGGRSAMSRGRRSKARRRPRRRNPMVMSLTNPRRRRSPVRRSRRSSVRRSGGLFGMVDIQSTMYVAGGAIGYGVVPGLVTRFFPQLPTTGLMGYGLKVGSAIALGWVTKMATGSNMRARQVVTGAMAIFLLEMYQTQVAPRLGLGGFVNRNWGVPGNHLGEFVPRAWAVPGDKGRSSRMFSGNQMSYALMG